MMKATPNVLSLAAVIALSASSIIVIISFSPTALTKHMHAMVAEKHVDGAVVAASTASTSRTTTVTGEMHLHDRTYNMKSPVGNVDALNDTFVLSPMPPMPLLMENDSIYPKKINASTTPIVVEEYRLVFFPVEKVGSTVLLQLMRRMMNYTDWRRHGKGVPHMPWANGLKYLTHYSLDQANEMLTSPNWTRAMFVRDPKERVLSAFLQWGKSGHLHKECCARLGEGNETVERNCMKAVNTFPGFVRHIEACPNQHWSPLCHFRMEAKFYASLNFVGHIETAGNDVKRLFAILGNNTYEQFGAGGWGDDGTEPMFHSTATVTHSKNAHAKLEQFYTPELREEVEQIFDCDYQNEVLEL